MIAVRVLRQFGLWNAGEIAGFPPERAQQLIANGFAEAASPQPAAEPEAEADPPATRRTRSTATRSA